MEDCVDELVNSLSEYNKEEEVEDTAEEEAEENGTSKSSSGGGLIKQIISHLAAAITGISDASAAGESSNEGEVRDEPDAEKAEEPEGIISSQHVTLPVVNGPDPEEATILISIIHD